MLSLKLLMLSFTMISLLLKHAVYIIAAIILNLSLPSLVWSRSVRWLRALASSQYKHSRPSTDGWLVLVRRFKLSSEEMCEFEVQNRRNGQNNPGVPSSSVYESFFFLSMDIQQQSVACFSVDLECFPSAVSLVASGFCLSTWQLGCCLDVLCLIERLLKFIRQQLGIVLSLEGKQ